MGWADIFPVLDDTMVARYQAEASAEDQTRLQRHFEIAEIIERKPARHIAAVSLFWKPMWREEQDYPPPTRALMQNPARKGLSTRFGNPWTHYVDPLLRAAKLLSKEQPEVTLRVYLAHDLSFLIDDLVTAGCEVFLMQSSSLRACPGMMWRFLALEAGTLVTMIDSDLGDSLLPNLERTELMASGGLKYWRTPFLPGPGQLNHGNPGWYRTSVGTHSGSTLKLSISLLAQALLWNLEKGHLRDHCTIGPRKIPIWGAKWPDYGFDEFFLNTVIFPRAAKEGILTLLNREDTSQSYWLALDIEHCLKKHPHSEIMFWSDPEPVV